MASADIKVELSDDKEAAEFISAVYDVTKISEQKFSEWYEFLKYKGFDRRKVLKELYKRVGGDIEVTQQIIMLCGMQGPRRASTTRLPNGRIVSSYGIPASGAKGSEGISCGRITAATADLCAYFLRKVNFPKRLNVACPGWLQFPSAGSITLPENYRVMHIEFSQKFSPVIGGVFNEQIYMQMTVNSYLDPKLKLFNDDDFGLVVVPAPASIVSGTRSSEKPRRP